MVLVCPEELLIDLHTVLFELGDSLRDEFEGFIAEIYTAFGERIINDGIKTR